MPNHEISLEEASAMTKRFREQKDNVLKPEYKDILPLCETFDRTAFDQLTKESGCTTIRCYLGMDENLNVKLIFVAGNAKGDDILPPTADAKIMEFGERCPPICPGVSPLNA